MTLTHFAMVEELAFLVKDNLPCKHLILSLEDALVNFLQDNDTSSDGVLELKPMNSYSRLLVHRLADIFGFAHESVGEREDRHLVLERCPETSIPPILVSDILWEHEEPQPLMRTCELLNRNEAPLASGTEKPFIPQTFEEREASYKAARERIFSSKLEEVRENIKQKPQSNPVVARRMIAHALGHRSNSSNRDVSIIDSKKYAEKFTELNISDDDKVESFTNKKAQKEALLMFDQKKNPYVEARRNGQSGNTPSHERHTSESMEKSANISKSQHRRNGNSSSKNLKEEHLGAAKRMFAHALGRQSAKECP